MLDLSDYGKATPQLAHSIRQNTKLLVLELLGNRFLLSTYYNLPLMNYFKPSLHELSICHTH